MSAPSQGFRGVTISGQRPGLTMNRRNTPPEANASPKEAHVSNKALDTQKADAFARRMVDILPDSPAPM